MSTPESKGASPDRRRVRPQWWEYPDDVEIELLKAAPEMAAMLRQIEWAGSDEGFEICPVCDATKVIIPGNPPKHQADCPLDALLGRIGR